MHGHSKPAGYDQHISSFVSPPKIPNSSLIQADTVPHRCTHPSHGKLGDERLPNSQLIVAVVTFVLLGPIADTSRAGLCGSSGGGSCRSHSATLSATLTLALVTSLTAALSAVDSCSSSRRYRGARSNFLATVTRPTSCPRRVAPTFATSDRCPAIRLVRIEILNRWRGSVVAYGIIRTIKVKRQGRVLLRIGNLIVDPLLMLSCLSPVEIIGQGGCREPIVCVGGLNEAL